MSKDQLPCAPGNAVCRDSANAEPDQLGSGRLVCLNGTENLVGLINNVGVPC